MKASTALIAFALFAVASAAPESSSGALASHWTGALEGFNTYYWQPMDFLVAIFWKYIMYGTFYVLVEQIYCNFFPTALNTVLATVAVGSSNPLGTDADPVVAGAACKEYFWVWYNQQFYWGNYNSRPFYLA